MTRAIAVALVSASLGWAAQVTDSQTIERRFAPQKQVVVDGVFGSITVSAGSPGEIRMLAHRRLRADSPQKAEEANRDVRLDIGETGGVLRLYVDGPFRHRNCCCSDGCGRCDDGEPGYRVAYDFELRVPEHTDLTLKTVLDGDVRVSGVAGRLELRNVNGRLEAEEVDGTLDMKTVNGGIHATFRHEPTGACSFRTVNGEVEARFPRTLSADLRFRTFNGEVWTDFDVGPLPREVVEPERREGRFVYRSTGHQGVRIAQGGPELRFDTLNGTIRVLSSK